MMTSDTLLYTDRRSISFTKMKVNAARLFKTNVTLFMYSSDFGNFVMRGND